MTPRAIRFTALCALPLMLFQGVAQAALHTVEVTSTGNEVSVPLPPGTQEVELESQRAGNCRFGRTWGYDLSARQLWVNGGCSGVFKVHVRDDAVPATASAPSDASNAAAGLAAMAAIAGVAILASQGNKHHNNNSGYYPPPTYPPQGYPPPPPPPGAYPGGYPQGGWAPPPGSRQSLMRHASGACMDAKDSARPGSPINIYDCHGRANQVFFRTPAGEMVVQGMCVQQAGAMQPGDRLVAAPCNGSPIQRWSFYGAQVRNMQSGMCLDALNGQARRGVAVAAYPCNPGVQGQRWFW
jgi:hypothetical protein